MNKPVEADQILRNLDNKARAAALPLAPAGPAKALLGLGDMGDQPQLRAVSALVIAAGLLRANRTTLRTTAAKSFIKHRIDRTRPRSARMAADPLPRPGNSRAKEQSSFPSGHSAGAMAVARAIAREHPQHRGAASAAALAIALIQIPRDAHYASDVIAGLAIGLAAEALVHTVW